MFMFSGRRTVIVQPQHLKSYSDFIRISLGDASFASLISPFCAFCAQHESCGLNGACEQVFYAAADDHVRHDLSPSRRMGPKRSRQPDIEEDGCSPHTYAW